MRSDLWRKSRIEDTKKIPLPARTERGFFAFTQHTDARFFEALGRRFLPSAPSCLVQDVRYLLE